MNHTFYSENGGYILANELIKQTELIKGLNKPLRLLAMSGDRIGASKKRTQGLLQRLNKSNNIRLVQNVLPIGSLKRQKINSLLYSSVIKISISYGAHQTAWH